MTTCCCFLHQVLMKSVDTKIWNHFMARRCRTRPSTVTAAAGSRLRITLSFCEARLIRTCLGPASSSGRPRPPSGTGSRIRCSSRCWQPRTLGWLIVGAGSGIRCSSRYLQPSTQSCPRVGAGSCVHQGAGSQGLGAG